MIRIIVSLLFLSTQALAAQGIHISYQMQMSADSKTKMSGTSEYYFQDGNIRAEVNMQGTPLGKTVFIEKNGKRYTLFPSDKTYMEVTDFSQKYATQQKKIQKSSPYKATGQKKTIAGYECEVFVKENQMQKETACLSKSLMKVYASLIRDMKKVNQDMDISQGVPLEMASVGKGKNSNTTKMKVLKINPNPKGVSFTIPKGYKKKEAAQMSPQFDSMVKDLQMDAKDGQIDEAKIKELQKMAEEMKKKYGQ